MIDEPLLVMRMRERAATALKPGLALLALVAWVSLAVPPAALAHAQVLSQDPGPGARILTSPGLVRVVFDEPVTLGPEGLRVLDSDGLTVDVGAEILDLVAVD